MSPLKHHRRERAFHGGSFLLATLYLFGTACSSTATTGKNPLEDPRGTVSVQAISDQSIQASHPINLDPALIARLLSGLQVQEHQRALQEMLAGASSATPVFSEEQVQFLAPRIAKALMAATAGEVVTFRVTNPRQGTGRLENSVAETTSGSLYAYGLSLYVTLSQYRYAPSQPNADSSAHSRLLDTSGLSNRTLHFTPSGAQRSESFNRQSKGASTDRVIAIDYQLLQRPVISTVVTEQPPPPAERAATPARELQKGPPASDTHSQAAETLAQREAEIHTLKDLVIKKDLELESLRKELQSIRKELDSQTTRQDSQKRKTTPSSKPQQTAP